MQWFCVVNLNKDKPAQGIYFFFLSVHQKRKEEKKVKMHNETQHVSSAG